MGKTRNAYLPQEIDDALAEEVDYPDETIGSWLCGAAIIRLAMDNDDQFLEECEETLKQRLDLET